MQLHFIDIFMRIFLLFIAFCTCISSFGKNNSEAIHPNERVCPYPRENHKPYLNPVPLLVPQDKRKDGEYLEFELSNDKDFNSEKTFRSGKLQWNMFNLHKEMSVGKWYWRYRTVGSGGTSEWSSTNKFNITGEEDVFVTPDFSIFKKNLPKEFPRLHCYLNSFLPEARNNIKSNPEYNELLKRAQYAMDYEIKSDNPYDEISKLHSNVDYFLYPAYMLTLDVKYQNKMLDILRTLLKNEISDKDLFKDDFFFPNVGVVLADIYDVCRELMTEDECHKVEDILVRISGKAYDLYRGKLENHIFDNHVWQITLCGCMRAALMVYDKDPIAMSFLEYCYEVWTARAPASGFNRDGAWINGIGYFNTNVHTLYYMPMMLSYITGTNFFEHPWYKSSGKALVYSWLPDTGATGFGDGSGISSENSPFRLRVAFADVIARELHDPYAAWYVKACGKTVHGDIAMRLYRMAKSHIPYNADSLKELDFENFIWYKDIGEGIAFSDMLHPNKNLSLAFRSSPFGSGSHTLSDQNSFKILYKGKYVYMNVGYYQNFCDKHNLLQYRHTRGHNSILVNGIGQPFTTRAYGNISRAMNSDNLAYFLGDASNAYCGVSEYPMWKRNFENAGIEQTSEYGFGETPLTNFKRHIFLLRPNIVVIYDDLSANTPVSWQWLLHSPVEFIVEGQTLTTNYSSNGGFKSVANIFSEHTPQITKTNDWYKGGEPNKPSGVEKQWSLTANFSSLKKNKILTVIQLTDSGKVEKIIKSDKKIIVGDWSIKVELGCNKKASIIINNDKKGTCFIYRGNKSVLNDFVNNNYIKQECLDADIQSTY